jgi:hypothetical protein
VFLTRTSVILNAVDAAGRGADIRAGARCIRADRLDIRRAASGSRRAGGVQWRHPLEPPPIRR